MVAVHLGHHNPPIDELERRLRAPAAGPAAHHPLVLGGVRSGKSRHAEHRPGIPVRLR
ncbi:hypothetical protein [Nocardia carnea]|uniref:hypothetical protein n=1 Tax=Nocardia carnea TaxID=37328 RepID=UPI003D7790A8